jgi:hypothetical protein
VLTMLVAAAKINQSSMEERSRIKQMTVVANYEMRLTR